MEQSPLLRACDTLCAHLLRASEALMSAKDGGVPFAWFQARAESQLATMRTLFVESRQPDHDACHRLQRWNRSSMLIGSEGRRAKRGDSGVCSAFAGCQSQLVACLRAPQGGSPNRAARLRAGGSRQVLASGSSLRRCLAFKRPLSAWSRSAKRGERSSAGHPPAHSTPPRAAPIHVRYQ